VAKYVKRNSRRKVEFGRRKERTTGTGTGTELAVRMNQKKAMNRHYNSNRHWKADAQFGNHPGSSSDRNTAE